MNAPTIDRFKVLFGLVMKLLRLLFQLLEPPFSINIYRIFRGVTNAKALLECLGCSSSSCQHPLSSSPLTIPAKMFQSW